MATFQSGFHTPPPPRTTLGKTVLVGPAIVTPTSCVCTLKSTAHTAQSSRKRKHNAQSLIRARDTDHQYNPVDKAHCTSIVLESLVKWHQGRPGSRNDANHLKLSKDNVPNTCSQICRLTHLNICRIKWEKTTALVVSI